MNNAQANVIAEKCIACGRCISECPQGAKQYRSDIETVNDLLKSNKNIAISVAPSFVSVFEEWQQKSLPSALRKLGFTYISETAVGAYHSAVRTAQHIEKNPNSNHICSACPVVVNYIERFEPQLISTISPVVSPMIAHAKILKHKLGTDSKVVFVGPCIAKKMEAARPEFIGYVDAVLTFEELQELFNTNNIKLSACEESNFDDSPAGDSRLFPLEGGLLKTAGINTDLLSNNTIAISGAEEIKDALRNLHTSKEPVIIEPLWCKSGCINGPAIPEKNNSFQSRKRVLNYAANQPKTEDNNENINTRTYFKYDAPEIKSEFSEEEIKSVFEKTGKTNVEDQLNCGACGYDNCRLNAIAVLQGIAEIEMCIPFMRRAAEQKSNTILDQAPNGIIVLDDKLNILSVNPSFKRMFSCTNAIIGKPISYMIDQDPFEKLIADPNQVIKKIVKYGSYNLICNQIHYAIPDDNHYIGVFVDITNIQQNEIKLTDLKTETIIQAQELIDHQIEMAQQMAKFLGENTAKGETLMRNLIKVIDDK
jgi:iron only hydrogenase large subunit-like protein